MIISKVNIIENNDLMNMVHLNYNATFNDYEKSKNT